MVISCNTINTTLSRGRLYSFCFLPPSHILFFAPPLSLPFFIWQGRRARGGGWRCPMDICRSHKFQSIFPPSGWDKATFIRPGWRRPCISRPLLSTLPLSPAPLPPPPNPAPNIPSPTTQSCPFPPSSSVPPPPIVSTVFTSFLSQYTDVVTPLRAPPIHPQYSYLSPRHLSLSLCILPSAVSDRPFISSFLSSFCLRHLRTALIFICFI